jgi:tRNA pseudouridine38-40 synthase
VSSSSLARYRLVIHYDGFPFHGWQVQTGQRTVQGEIEEVLRRVTGARRPLVGSGRTDAGVHALGQVASVDVPRERWEARELRAALNALLPREIWIESVARVSGGFHPRYDARSRSYLYRVGLAHRAGSPFHAPWCWNLSRREAPDPELLRAGASLVVGERQFGGFAKAGQPERGVRCRVTSAEWAPWEDLGLEFRITADRFLHHMVRYLVGTMVDVATGRRLLEEIRELLQEPRTELTMSAPAPPEGLFLLAVEYDEEGGAEDGDRDPPEP